jgi:hypothetical protein
MRRDSYLPSSPATLQALDRMEYTMTNAVAEPYPGPRLCVRAQKCLCPAQLAQLPYARTARTHS